VHAAARKGYRDRGLTLTRRALSPETGVGGFLAASRITVHAAARKGYRDRGLTLARSQLVAILGDPKHRGNRLRALSIGSGGTPKKPLTASEAHLSAKALHDP
jgi:hypothetical protein